VENHTDGGLVEVKHM